MKLSILAIALLLASCASKSVTQSVPELSPSSSVLPSKELLSPSSKVQEPNATVQESIAVAPSSAPTAGSTKEIPEWGSSDHCIDALQANLIREGATINIERYEVERSVYLAPDEGALAEVRYFGEFRLNDKKNSAQTYLDAYCAVYEPGSVDVRFPTSNGQWAWIKIDESGYNASSEMSEPPFEGWTDF